MNFIFSRQLVPSYQYSRFIAAQPSTLHFSIFKLKEHFFRSFEVICESRAHDSLGALHIFTDSPTIVQDNRRMSVVYFFHTTKQHT